MCGYDTTNCHEECTAMQPCITHAMSVTLLVANALLSNPFHLDCLTSKLHRLVEAMWRVAESCCATALRLKLKFYGVVGKKANPTKHRG